MGILTTLQSGDTTRIKEALQGIKAFRDSDKSMTTDLEAIIARLQRYDFKEARVLEGFGQLEFIAIDRVHLMKIKTRNDCVYAMYVRALEDDVTRRLCMRIAYDGTYYTGFQRQRHAHTVQGTLEEALRHLLRHPISLTPAGRTDKGVHAMDQVIHLDTSSPLDDMTIQSKLNRVLPKAIRVRSIQTLPRVFHARFDALWKTYMYVIAKHHDPFLAHHATVSESLDVARFKEIITQVSGTHDFKGVAKDTSDAITTRTIQSVHVEEDETMVRVYIKAQGFLRHMVRIIVGNAIRDTKKGTTTLRDALNYPVADRPKYMADASGLYLYHIEY